MKSMDDLFLHGLQDIYTAEKRILQSLPTMAQSVGTNELKQALEQHRDETQQHVRRLEEVFKMIGEKPKGVECKAIDGIIGEAQQEMKEIEDDAVCEAAIIASAQAVEHYEITRYGTLTAWAKQLGHTDAANLLHETLEEEKHTDELLTKLAKEKINRAAA
ncbi:MAG: ferritin-like domain-containing protein [Hyphomicrobiaceae bacterium]|nr:ferritin-like domain-containing protein [Hyphomicrobiaceae bacterium]